MPKPLFEELIGSRALASCDAIVERAWWPVRSPRPVGLWWGSTYRAHIEADGDRSSGHSDPNEWRLRPDRGLPDVQKRSFLTLLVLLAF